MKLSSLFIAVLLIGGIATGILTVYGDMVYQYKDFHTPTSIADSTNTSHLNWTDSTKNITDATQGISGKIQNITSGDVGITAFDDSILLLSDIGKYFLVVIGTGTNMLNDMFNEDRLGITLPPWLLPLLIGILLIIVIFAIISIFAKRDV